MKKFLLLAASVVCLGASLPAHADSKTYSFDPNHTNIVWHASHFGFSSPSGRFGVVEGNIMIDENDLATSTVDVTIDVAGLVTGIPKFDEHLKSADFLDTEKFPTAHFKSTSVDVTGEKTAKVHGDFTLHGVTKPVTLDVTLNKKGEHPFSKKDTVGFSAMTTLKRSDFGVSMYSPNVSEDVEIAIEAEASVE